MPGIVTHTKILNDSIALLAKKDKKSFLFRSIESLFNSEEYYRIALFGALGPNIFDYIPVKRGKSYFGSETSFLLHNNNPGKIVSSMIKRIFSYDDKNNEWSAAQRAYLYGYISHMIADEVIHPFVFFWSGFPEEYSKKEVNYYREQNLIFQYNIDNYFLYYDESKDKLNFSIDNFIPEKNKRIRKINPAVKSLILETIETESPEIYKKIIWREGKGDDKKYSESLSWLDFVPYFLKSAYKLKTTKNKKIINLIDFIKRNKLFYSDFLIKYPAERNINRHVLNFHKERWQYPVEETGFKYESIDILMNTAIGKVVQRWEMIESSLYEMESGNVENEFILNAYTGTKNSGYYDMEKKEPVRLVLP